MTSLIRYELMQAGQRQPSWGEPDRDAVCSAALAYIAAGVSIMPIGTDGTKSPAFGFLPIVCDADGTPRHSWRVFQQRIPTAAEVRFWFSWGPVPGLAAIGGAVSGGLTILDFDAWDVVEHWAAVVDGLESSLLPQLVYVRTPRPGLHVYFRSSEVAGNQKLAIRLVTNPETGKAEKRTLIETRAEGGCALVPPSPYYCHPARRPYVFIGDRDLTQIPTISAGARQILLAATRRFDEAQARSRPLYTWASGQNVSHPNTGRPGDDFNARASWNDLLTRHNWTLVSMESTGIQHWRRPGKTSGSSSATVNFEGNDLLHVFSSNADPLEPGRSHSKFEFLVTVEFQGDFRAAARSLRVQGYGRTQLPFGRRRYRVHPTYR